MRFSYAQGYKDGQASGERQFERILAILREELADVRRDRDEQMRRADAAADLLLQHLGARAISLAGAQAEQQQVENKIKTVSALSMIPDPLDELPYDHPLSTYKSAKEASLVGGEDVATNAG